MNVTMHPDGTHDKTPNRGNMMSRTEPYVDGKLEAELGPYDAHGLHAYVSQLEANSRSAQPSIANHQALIRDWSEPDPIIRGLLVYLPQPGDVWPEEKRKLWLELVASIFKLIYKEHDTDGA